MNTFNDLFQNEQIAYNTSRPTITAMDPDAPLRQSKPLHDIDMVSIIVIGTLSKPV